MVWKWKQLAKRTPTPHLLAERCLGHERVHSKAGGVSSRDSLVLLMQEDGGKVPKLKIYQS